MAFNYNPNDAVSSWPADDYDGEIASIEEQTSKAGNDMLKLGVKVYHPDGRDKIVTDYIVNPTGLFKLKQIAMALGQGAVFNAGKFDPYSMKDKRICVSLKVTESEQYGEKNEVKKYSSPKVSSPAKPNPAAARSQRPGAIETPSPIGEADGIPAEEIPF